MLYTWLRFLNTSLDLRRVRPSAVTDKDGSQQAPRGKEADEIFRIIRTHIFKVFAERETVFIGVTIS